MTTQANPLSLQTHENTASLFAAPSSRSTAESKGRFRESLADQVSKSSSRVDRSREDPSKRTDSDRGINDRRGAQEPRTGADAADRGATDARNDRGESVDGSRDTDTRDTDTTDIDVTKDGTQAGAVDGQTPVDDAVAQTQAATVVEVKPVIVETVGAETPQSAETSDGEAAATRAGTRANESARSETRSASQVNTKQNATATSQSGVLVNDDGSQADADGADVIDEDVDRAAALPVTNRPAKTANGRDSTDDRIIETQSVQETTVQANESEAQHEHGHSATQHDDAPTLKLAGSAAGNDSASAFQLNGAERSTTEQTNGEVPRGPVLSVITVSDDGTPENERAVAASVSRGLAAAVQQRGGSLKIRLTPATLGEVRIELDLNQGRVSVDLHASTDIAQDALAKNIAMLRSSLESKGLSVERITVQLTPSTSQPANTNNDQQSNDSARDQQGNQHDASDGQSRGSRDGEHSDQRDRHEHFGARFDDAFGLEPGDPRAQTLRLRLSAVG